MGPEAELIRDLFYILRKEDVDETKKEDEFKKGLIKIVKQYPNLFNIAKSLKKYAKKSLVDDTRLWRLADEVEPGIRQAWENYKKKS